MTSILSKSHLRKKLILFSFFFILLPEVALSTVTDGELSVASSWQFPKIKGSSSKGFISLYCDNTNKLLLFDQWDGSNWQAYTTIDATILGAAPGAGGHTMLSCGREERVAFDIDSNGRLHTVFTAGISILSNTHDPIYGVYDGSWSFTVLEDGSYSPVSIAMKVSNTDTVHVAYTTDNLSAANNSLKYMTNMNGSWSSPQQIVATLNRGDDELHDIYIAVNSTNQATIIYRREDNQNNGQDSYYTTSSSDSFSGQNIILDGQTDSSIYRLTNMAIDNFGTLHLAYNNLTDSTAHYLFGSGGNFTSEQLLSSSYTIFEAQYITLTGITPWILVNSSAGNFFMSKKSTTWEEGEIFVLQGNGEARVSVLQNPLRFMVVTEDNLAWTAYYSSLEIPKEEFPWLIFMPGLSSPNKMIEH